MADGSWRIDACLLNQPPRGSVGQGDKDKDKNKAIQPLFILFNHIQPLFNPYSTPKQTPAPLLHPYTVVIPASPPSRETPLPVSEVNSTYLRHMSALYSHSHFHQHHQHRQHHPCEALATGLSIGPRRLPSLEPKASLDTAETWNTTGILSRRSNTPVHPRPALQTELFALRCYSKRALQPWTGQDRKDNQFDSTGTQNQNCITY